MATTKKKAPVASNTVTLAPVVQVLTDLYAEAAQRVLRLENVTLPEVLITVQRDRRNWGHITLWNAWTTGDTGRLELMVSGENLARGPVAVLGTLLHEAAHAYNLVKGVRDCDSQGRHNKRFKTTAERVFGLVIDKNRHGWSETTVPEATQADWADGLARLTEALAVSAVQAPVKPPKRRDTNLTKFVCDGCDASLRASEATFALGISHGCGGEFFPEVSADRRGDRATVRPDLLKREVPVKV
jgi:hypothetical protein